MLYQEILSNIELIKDEIGEVKIKEKKFQDNVDSINESLKGIKYKSR